MHFDQVYIVFLIEHIVDPFHLNVCHVCRCCLIYVCRQYRNVVATFRQCIHQHYVPVMSYIYYAVWIYFIIFAFLVSKLNLAYQMWWLGDGQSIIIRMFAAFEVEERMARLSRVSKEADHIKVILTLIAYAISLYRYLILTICEIISL